MKSKRIVHDHHLLIDSVLQLPISKYVRQHAELFEKLVREGTHSKK